RGRPPDVDRRRALARRRDPALRPVDPGHRRRMDPRSRRQSPRRDLLRAHRVRVLILRLLRRPSKDPSIPSDPWQNSRGMKTKSRFLRAPVEPFVVLPDAAAGDLLARMERISFQGRNLATARRIWEKMLGDDCTIFLGMAGALSAGGLRMIV